MFVALTGAYFAFPKTYEAIAAWAAHRPSVLLAPRTEIGAPRHINLDAIYATAVQAMPAGETTLFTFPQQKNAPYSLRRMLPGDWRRTGDNLVYLDQYSGRVIRVNYHARLPWPVRLIRDMSPLHFGTFGGNITRVLWIVVGVAPAILFVTSLLMWWNRSILPFLRRNRRKRSAPLGSRPRERALAK
jgi:uncharacterized iron-regulated membrane protein